MIELHTTGLKNAMLVFDYCRREDSLLYVQYLIADARIRSTYKICQQLV